MQQKCLSLQFWRLEFEIKVLADSVPGEDPLPGLQVATFLLCPYTVERECASCISSYKDTNPIMGAPPL